MKRRAHLPLFAATEPDVYLPDTSAWLNIESRSDCEDVWRIIIALINEGRLFICAQVLGELRDDPIYLSRLKRYEKALLAGDRDDLDYLQHVGRVTHDHPGMSKATGPRTPADSYVVALAELENYVVVADEDLRKRPNRKIPGVCRQRGIRCLTLVQFIKAENCKIN